MQRDKIWDYEVQIDKAATAGWYEKSEGWGCECGHCQNFLALVRQKQLPTAVLDLLSNLNILPEKPTYVCEICPTEKGNLYQFNYRVAGCILNEPHPNDTIQFDWGEGFCGHDSYPYGAPDFPEPYFDVMFFMEFPWVLDEQESKRNEAGK